MKNAFNYSGRARRSEFWFFRLMTLIILIAFVVFMGTSTYGILNSTSPGSGEVSNSTKGLGILTSILILVFVILWIWTIFANIAVLVRRMHDTNRSGWYAIIPIYNFILSVTEGDRGENYYGQDPKGGTEPMSKDSDILDA